MDDAASQYEGMPNPDLFLITHCRGEHYNTGILTELAPAQILANADVKDMMPEILNARAGVVAPGESRDMMAAGGQAIPWCNITEPGSISIRRRVAPLPSC